LETPLADPEHLPSNAFTSMRLLISHNLMGSIIGKSGATIKQIQDASGARMVASKEMLPQSTERVVEIQGNVEAIKQAVHQIGECLLRDWDRAQGTIYYQPGAAGDQGVLAGGLGAATVTGPTGGIRRASATPAFGGNGERRMSRAAEGGNGSGQGLPPASLPAAGQGSFGGGEVDPNLRTQSISIPSDMVGCIM
jgi:heterogeneous nuclear rnp K-like protein 2